MNKLRVNSSIASYGKERMRGMNKSKNSMEPRPEHPRPQFERKSWINLNGEWSYEFDFGKSGMERGLQSSKGFDGKIIVPFCPESGLSGVGHKDFIETMWYQRRIDIPKDWGGGRIFLRFGAVDFECEAFVDGKSVGRHWGGSSSFAFDITGTVKAGGAHSLVLYVRDELRSGAQPYGKQCFKYQSCGCSYTRTTGIWQTVWLELVDHRGLESCKIVPDVDGSQFLFHPRFLSIERGQKWRVTVSDGSKKVSSAEGAALNESPLACGVKTPKLWSPESPFLYDVTFEVVDDDGKAVDTVKSYAGLRKIHVEGDRIYLNNEPIYLRLVLDQGFYPDGIWTAPSDGALKRDIELSMKAGFNGARLHQKVFEERFHYWADKLGYLTWGEYPSWGMTLWRGNSEGGDQNRHLSAWNFMSEWCEVVVRDRNHPSIIAWTPLNETRDSSDWRVHNRMHVDIYDLTRELDSTRPVNEASGYVHVKTDLWTVHNYEQNGAKLKEQLTKKSDGEVWKNYPNLEAKYTGQPYLVDEFGGIKWVIGKPFAGNTWGYGEAPKSIEEVYERLESQVDAIRGHKHISGFCYTQLTDVEQEQNGVYNYDRTEKFDMARISKIFSRQ